MHLSASRRRQTPCDLTLLSCGFPVTVQGFLQLLWSRKHFATATRTATSHSSSQGRSPQGVTLPSQSYFTQNLSYTRTQAHTCMHTRTHTAHTCMHIHKRMHASTHVHAHTHMHTHAHTLMHIHTCMHTQPTAPTQPVISDPSPAFPYSPHLSLTESVVASLCSGF